MDREERLSQSLALCRESGLAMTVQRRAILEELVSRRDHPSADQIFETVAGRVPGLSRTTVYRVLEAFVRAGAARKVSHPDAVARFDPIHERHHHLQCEKCGTLFDLEDSELRGFAAPRSVGSFVVRDYSINFTGVCAGCRDSKSAKKDKKGSHN
jgi:Fur family peroxide stress response transcriptional regulator